MTTGTRSQRLICVVDGVNLREPSPGGSRCSAPVEASVQCVLDPVPGRPQQRGDDQGRDRHGEARAPTQEARELGEKDDHGRIGKREHDCQQAVDDGVGSDDRHRRCGPPGPGASVPTSSPTVPGSLRRSGPSGIEQIRSLVHPSRVRRPHPGRCQGCGDSASSVWEWGHD